MADDVTLRPGRASGADVAGPSSPPRNRRFQGRGVLHEDALYVERPADRQLVRELALGTHCHVLAPRQVGKTNLRIRAARRLRELTSPRGERIRCASVDLMAIGGEAPAEQWYYGLVERILRQLKLPADLPAFWDETSKLPLPQRFYEAMLRLVLGGTGDAVVIFLDEINVALDLPFSRDEVFRTIMAIQNARGDEPDFQRLTFCLIGVATPLDLVDDLRTPFNKSLGIELEDFTRQEVEAFRDALSVVRGDPDKLLDELFAWTHGHPAQMQQLCERLASDSIDGESDERTRVRDLVKSLYLSSGRTEDPILLEVHDFFAGTGPSRGHATEMLQAYRKILEKERDGEKTPASHGASLRLRILGIIAVRRDAGGATWLRPRNLVFGTVFDLAWVDAQLRARSHYADPFTSWLVHDKSSEFVLTGRQLEEALRWAKEQTDVPAEEWEFLNASRDVADQKRKEQEEAALRREEERRASEEERKASEEERKAKDEALLKARSKLEEERRAHDRELQKRRRRGMIVVVVFVILPALIGTFLLVRQQALASWLNEVKRSADDAVVTAEAKASEAETRAKQAQEAADVAKGELLRANDEAKAALQQADTARSSADEARLRAQAALRRKDEADRQKKSAEDDVERARSEADIQRQRAERARRLVADTTSLGRELSDAILRAERAEAEVRNLRNRGSCQPEIDAARGEARDCATKLHFCLTNKPPR